MPICKDKYRGTTQYALVLRELITAASYRGSVTYQEVGALMGLPLVGSYMGREVGQLVGEISEDEVNRGRPMLSAVVVSVKGTSSEGFFALAELLGRLTDRSKAADQKFWESERNAAYQTWQKPLPLAKDTSKAT